MIKKLYTSIVLLIFSSPCMATDNDFYDVMHRINNGDFIRKIEQKRQERQEKSLIEKFNNDFSKKGQAITIDQYEDWKGLIYKAITDGYENFIKLLEIHIETNCWIQAIIETLSLSPRMKESLTQLDEQLPKLTKHICK